MDGEVKDLPECAGALQFKGYIEFEEREFGTRPGSLVLRDVNLKIRARASGGAWWGRRAGKVDYHPADPAAL